MWPGRLQPALFLHFAQSFADEKERRSRQNRVLIGLTYLPAIAIVGLQVYALNEWSATGLLAHRLEQTALAYLDFYYVLAATVLYVHYRRTDVPLRRQQLKWLTRGTVVAITPFTLGYVLPFLAGRRRAGPGPQPFADPARGSAADLLLGHRPLPAHGRGPDLQARRHLHPGYRVAARALTSCWSPVAASLVHTRLPSAGVYGLIATIIITSALFDPIKRTIQNRVDRVFDRKRYDYRQTLVEFGRGLSTQTDLGDLLEAIVERLPQTLLVARVAVFLPEGAGYRLAAGHGLPTALYDGSLPPTLIRPARSRLLRFRPARRRLAHLSRKSAECAAPAGP